MKLYKTTLVIWTDYDPGPRNMEISDIAREAECGDAYCSTQNIELIENPEEDDDWDDTEFFEIID